MKYLYSNLLVLVLTVFFKGIAKDTPPRLGISGRRATGLDQFINLVKLRVFSKIANLELEPKENSQNLFVIEI